MQSGHANKPEVFEMMIWNEEKTKANLQWYCKISFQYECIDISYGQVDISCDVASSL